MSSSREIDNIIGGRGPFWRGVSGRGKPRPYNPYTGLMALVVVFLVTACNMTETQGNASPTPLAEAASPTAASVTDTPPPSETWTPSPTVPLVPVLESPTPSPTPGPPTEPPTPTETPGPFEHTIRQNETLGYIIQLYGYTNFNVIDQIVAMNANIPSADRLPGEGAVILIPRPTATLTPEGFEATAVVATPVPVVPPEDMLLEYTIKAGETIVGVAAQYETTLAILDQLNPELQFFNCDFSNPSGGPECNVPLSVGQVVKVPAPTPTPTLSPTPSGSETPTPTPTYAAPLMVSPPNGANVQGRSIRLEWVSTGILPPDQHYLVEVEDTTTGQSYPRITRETAYVLSGEIVPADGQPHEFRWRIRVAMPTESGTFRPISGEPTWRTFTWTNQ